MPDAFGDALIALIKQAGEYGSFFTYEQYQELKRIKTLDEFHAFARQQKLGFLLATQSPDEAFAVLVQREQAAQGAAMAALGASDLLVAGPSSNSLICFLLAAWHWCRHRVTPK